MSLFGSHKSNNSLFSGDAGKKVSPPHKFDWGAAALSFMGVDPSIFIGRRRQQAAQAAEMQVRAGLKARGYSDSDIDVLMQDPKQASALIAQVLQPRQFGPEGGSLGTPGADGKLSFQMAPSQRQIGRDVVNIGSDGSNQRVYHGLEPVSVPDVGLFAWDNQQGIVNPPGSGAPTQPMGGPPASAPMGPRRINSKAEMDALPRGTPFIGPDGQVRIAPGIGGASPSNGSTSFP